MRATTRQIHLTRDRTVPPLPVLQLDSGAAGATVVVTANVHGDETTGLAAAHRLVDTLREGGLQRGRVVVLPSLNPGGLAAATRAVPGDGNDLNRAFPGKRSGRTSDRLARRIWDELTEIAPDVLIDLHADAASSIPYALLDRCPHLRGAEARRMQDHLDRLGRATGLTVVREYPSELYLRYSLDRSLAGALVNHARIPTVTIEAGPRRIIDPSAVEVVLQGILGICRALELRDGPAADDNSRVEGGPWRRHAGPRVQVAGWLQPVVAPGQTFRPGQVLASIRTVDGRIAQQVQAERAGLVLSWIESTWVELGTVIGTLAVKDD